MRSYTIFVSVVAHCAAVAALVSASIMASDVLPAVRRSMDFIHVRAIAPPPPPRRAPTTGVTPPTAAVIPFDAPSGIHEELPVEPPPAATDADSIVASDAPLPAPPISAVPPPVVPREPIRVGGLIQAPRKLSTVAPVYPPIARSAHVEGLVILEAIIGEDGQVRDVRALKTNPLLEQAAVDAVRQWRFTPTLLNGEPVSVVMTVTVMFSLH